MKKVLGVVMLAVFLLTNTAVVTVSAQEQNKEDNNENQVNEQILEFKAKEKIYSEILKSNETIDLSDIYSDNDSIGYNEWRENIKRIFYELCGDNYIQAVIYNTEGYKLGVKYISNDNNEDAIKYNPQANYEADRIIKQYITDDLSDLEKEMILVHYLIDNCKYNEKSSRDNNYLTSAYGALIEKEATSKGYAEAIKLLLNKASIECEIINSDSLNHTWNIVKINNRYYQLDVSEMDKEDYDYIDYSYFNF